MAQNRSSAVMQQRVEPPDSLDDFPTPPWGTRALMRHVLLAKGIGLGNRRSWDPACNRGYMVRPLREFFDRVHASDVFDYSLLSPRGVPVFAPDGHLMTDDGQDRVVDFLWPNSESACIEKNPVDWVISNPPFRLAAQFIDRALAVARVGCAMLVRTSFLEGCERYETLYSVRPPTIIAQFVERIILTKGIVRDPSKRYWDETEQKWKRPSTATSYCWLVWVHGMAPQPFVWIPPCRVQLERPHDYPVDESPTPLTPQPDSLHALDTARDGAR